ncbi:MAG: chorismate synthase [Elusimicrobia bacterium]|nr:chorismate synthase [Elusimicrobiota bacterium]
MRYLTAGESHGKGLTGILEGLPAGLKLDVDYLMTQAARRKMGYGRGNRQKIETDAITITAGVRHGLTLGSPIALWIENKDFKNWQDVMSAEDCPGEVKRRVDVPRPGHADLVGALKYRQKDMRNILERASARETAIRVALGTAARRFLEELEIVVGSRVVSLGEVEDDTPAGDPGTLNARADKSPVRALGREKDLIAVVERAKAAGDTVGGVVEVVAGGVPNGLGSHVQWDRRLEAPIAQAFMSLNAIKGVEIGGGFRTAASPGSLAHDEFEPGKGGQVKYRSNRSGGVDGGISTGQNLVVRAAMKPLATLMKPLASVDLRTGKAASAHIERSDVCAVPSAAVIGESLLALVLAQAVLDKFGGDSMEEIVPRVRAWRKSGTSI